VDISVAKAPTEDAACASGRSCWHDYSAI
jgi:hypothetical protein